MISDMVLCDGPCQGHVPAADLEDRDGRALCSSCRTGHREGAGNGDADE